ncbi:O-antigen ligase family protein [Microbacterium luticocti]|uniref:O-antigen ligase family protein n=1 Tax=Microbacterium luticocti TaxID=451764 RepID=UPI0004154995|nr:O-antigen ligase family protein [Microbacterium luticocti]
MNTDEAPGRWLPELLRSAGMARAFTLTTMAAVFSSHAIQWTAGLVTYVTIVAGLCVVGFGMLVARHREISLLRLVPVSLVVFLAWTLLSVFWSESRSDTLVGWVSLMGIAFLAIVIGHVRDTLQTARALGDVMRWLLSISLAMEIFIGILSRAPVHWLGIAGDIVRFGPVEGIFGTRNMLGFVAVLALVTFVIEWRTASVRPGVAVYSVAVGGALAVLSRSPTVLAVAAAVGVATAALAWVRHTKPHDRMTLQWSLGAAAVVGVAAAYLFRHQLIAAAGPDFSIRANLWRVLSFYVRFYPVQGFGWFGPWPREQYPFVSINFQLGKHYSTALNAFADLVLQVGWLGLFLFVAMAGIAVIRSWLVAGERRSVVYAWTPLILVVLLVNSLFESFTLFGGGWMLLVICLVRAGQSRSWRERLDVTADAPLPVAHEEP